MEIGSSVRSSADGLVLDFHHLRFIIRAECVRPDEPTSLSQPVLISLHRSLSFADALLVKYEQVANINTDESKFEKETQSQNKIRKLKKGEVVKKSATKIERNG